MSEDAKNSLKLWLGCLAVVAVGTLLLRLEIFGDLAETVPSYWFWLLLGAAAAWELGRFAKGIWQRRERKPR